MATAKKRNSSRSRNSGRPKRNDGVQATIERMMGERECPDYLRHAAYRYLKTSLFPDYSAGRKKLSPPQKLAERGAQELLMNALELDQLLNNKTDKVVKILAGDISGQELSELLGQANRELNMRMKVYSDILRRLPKISEVLTNKTFDARTDLLAKLPLDQEGCSFYEMAAPFALSAVQRLEKIERQIKVSGPTANDLAEQAEAYIALNELRAGAEKARAAIAIDRQHGKAWYLRVIAALKQCNRALAKKEQYEIEATEIAEPMSGHERMAHENADEAAMEFSKHQENLDRLVPDALLNWPKSSWGSYLHINWHSTVVKLLVAQVFRKAVLGGELGYSNLAYRVNGFAPEWGLKYENIELPLLGEVGIDEGLGLTESELRALKVVIGEYDRCKSTAFGVVERDCLGWSFRLLHLRWMLKDAGYEKHWEDWSREGLSYTSWAFEDSVLRDQRLALLWVSHQARHGGISAVMDVLAQWQKNMIRGREQQNADRLLYICLVTFHHQFSRRDFNGCWQTCVTAEQLAENASYYGGNLAHPFEENISIPSNKPLYWQYLKALVAVDAKCANFQMGDGASKVLADSERWIQKFSAQDDCFWMYSIEFDEGGGEDYRVAPYNVDLTYPPNWIESVRGRSAYAEEFDASGESCVIKDGG